MVKLLLSKAFTSTLYHLASLTSISVGNIENQYLVKGAMFYTNTWQTADLAIRPLQIPLHHYVNA